MNEFFNYIPEIDPLPIPAPWWLLKFLLLLTFVLHIIPMNIMLGGLIMAGVSYFRGGQFHEQLTRKLTKIIPTVTALAITMGIAPLLFVQTLFGQYFYSASIIMAYPWLSVIILIMIGYYLSYINSFRFEKLNSGTRALVGWLGALCFIIVGFMYSNVMSLMLTPERWGPIYFADASGWNLNLAEPTLFPRYLHFLNGALAVVSCFIVFLGAFEKRDSDFRKKAISYGAKMFLIFTFAQYLLGTLWLITMPLDKALLFMGRHIPGTILFAIGLILPLGIIMMLGRAGRRDNPRGLVIGSGVTLLIVLIIMAIMRDILRHAYLQPQLQLSDMPSFFQASTVIPFAVLLVIGLGVVYWASRKFFVEAEA
ncbi:MAG: hypothetical protein GF307_06925 [candidate division Zixibacteria bacterium]|nr:hypothetical protein [candidate division Zixibacteria bacterium]